jgi:HTH-type transcriptional regulator / antitoxin HipB
VNGYNYPIWDNYMGHSAAIDAPADLGRAIRTARKKQKLTLALCAAANGVSVRFLSELERGKPGASVGAALKIARSVGLRVSVTELD